MTALTQTVLPTQGTKNHNSEWCATCQETGRSGKQLFILNL